MKYRGEWANRNRGWVINFQVDENFGPLYRVGQVEIGHSSETSLIQKTEGENLLREWDFRPLCGAVNYCVVRASRGFTPWTPTRALPWTHLELTVPPRLQLN